MSDTEHPAARNADQLAWAIWVGDDLSSSDVFAVTGNSEKEARRRALRRADSEEIAHVDGPYQDSEPGVWEFEFVTEHRERIVVEAPNESYASESADAERDYRGEYVETIHTESRRLDIDPNERSTNTETDQ